MRTTFNPSNYSFSTGEHNNKKVIWINFPKDPELIAQLRNAYPAAKWSATAKKWYLPDVPVAQLVPYIRELTKNS